MSVLKRRVNFNEAVFALMQDVARTMPEFAHIVPARILVVAGEARRASRGTVKPLTFQNGKSTDVLGRKKPIVRWRGKRMLYSITLRPLFFRKSTPQSRIGTLLHELYHISSKFDGTLDELRRHSSAGKEFSQKLRPLLRRYLRHCPAPLWEVFNCEGEVRILQWLEKPSAQYIPGSRMRRVYTEKQLFLGTVRMKTAGSGHE
jgi:hypothetical protein